MVKGDEDDRMDIDSMPGTGTTTPKIEATDGAAKPDLLPKPDDDEDDPITTTYPVFLNPSLPAGRRLLVLQHPNRTDNHPRPSPTELRIKAHTGMVELDVPLDSSTAYDKEKGLRWGKSLKASMQAKGGGSHGVAGGFAFGAPQQRGGGRGRQRDLAAEENDFNLDWNEAARQGKVLTTQTLGGQYPEVSDVQYMVGVFQGKNLHLTPVSSLVHLRPQPHHIDATNHLERQSSAKESAASSAGAGGGAGGSSAAGGARAIHMTIKTTAEGEAVTTETMADRLRSVQSENWRRMKFTDENADSAWDVYNESLFLQTDKETEEGQQPKVKEGDAEKDEIKAQEELETSVPRFKTKWGDKQLLEAVSDIKKPEPKEVEDAKKTDPKKDKGKQPDRSAKETAKPKAPSRTRGGGAAGGRRGGRAKVGASKDQSSVVVD